MVCCCLIWIFFFPFQYPLLSNDDIRGMKGYKDLVTKLCFDCFDRSPGNDLMRA
jgi:hypothetical protein